MVTEGIILDHLVSSQGIEVDKAKINIITSLPNPASVRKGFIKNFSKTALPLSKLLQKDVEFVFNKECIHAFEELKTILTSMPILQAPNWELQFELMCDPVRWSRPAGTHDRLCISNHGLGPDKLYNYRERATGNSICLGQISLLSAWLQSHHILRSCRHEILAEEARCQTTTNSEFDLEIKDKKGVDNAVVDHLSQIEREPNPMPIRDDFLDEQLQGMDTSTP
ncbi:Retrovirus-related Pol polyprotein, partial [Mucuna pruriens]